jgi:WD40 repeat protein
MRFLWILFISLAIGGGWSQAPAPTNPVDQLTATPITVDNVAELHSVSTIDAADLPAESALASGWFTLSPDGTHFAAVTRSNQVAIFDASGLVETYGLTEDAESPTVLDARFSADGSQLVSLHGDGEAFFVLLHTFDTDADPIEVALPDEVAGEALGIPVRVWIGASDETTEDISAVIWLETMPLDGGRDYKVISLPLDADGALIEDATAVIPSAPEQDTDAYVRIGRIPAPLAVTATQDGLVKLWNLETGEATYTIQLDDVPVFGRVNENGGTLLAWRDGGSLGLNVLDFESGENARVTDLDGDYIQALMLTPAGDTVLAVHIGDENNVVAWRVDTGERIDLGTYRDCTGVPDMVQLSQDGSTLVIGCDLGFEVWQVGDH